MSSGHSCVCLFLCLLLFFLPLHDVTALGSVLSECRGRFEGCGAGIDWQQGLMGYALEGAARGASLEARSGAPDGGEGGDVKDVSHAVYAHARRTLDVRHSADLPCPETALKKSERHGERI